MTKIKSDLTNIFKFPFKSTDGLNHELYVEIKDDYFFEAINSLAEKNFVLSLLFCSQNAEDGNFELFYIFQKQSHSGFLILTKNIEMKNPESSGVISIRLSPISGFGLGGFSTFISGLFTLISISGIR